MIATAALLASAAVLVALLWPEEPTDNISELVALAAGFLEDDNLPPAERLAVTALEQEPGNVRAREILADVRQIRDLQEEAERAARESEQEANAARFGQLESSVADTNRRLARQIAGVARQLENLQLRAAAEPQPEPEQSSAARFLDIDQGEKQELLEAGRAEYESGDLIRARVTLQRVLLIDQDDPVAQAYLSAAIFDQSPTDSEEREQAIRLARRATADDGVGAFAYATLGRIYEQERLPDQAEQAYESAIAIDPDYLPAYRGLSRLLLRRGEAEEAARYARRVTEARPEDPDARFTLLTTTIVNREWEEARDHATVLLRTDNASAAVYDYLARAQQGLGDCESAIDSWRRAFAIRPGWEYQRSIGHCYHNLLDPTAAVQAFVRAAEVNPRNTPDARDTAFGLIEEAARALGPQSRPQLAPVLYEDAARLLPNDPRVKERLAEAYVAAGQRRAARSTYEELIVLAPTFPEAHLSLARLYVQLGQTDSLRDLQRSLRRHRPGTDELTRVEELIDEVM